MGREDFEALRDLAKFNHDKRVADNPRRINYAIEQFKRHGIEYELKNEGTGHFHCKRKRDGKLFQFYAGTGKIQGENNRRGIDSLIRILTEENMSKVICPICEYEVGCCQCRYGGSCHPDRSKRREVVVDHLYLLSDEQIEHLKKVQAFWQTSYVDEEKNKILKELKNGQADD